MRSRLTLIAIAAGSLLIACKPKDEAVATDTTPTTAAATPVGGGEYSGAEMLGILSTVSDGDIEAGTLAQTKATDAQVKQLGATFVADHQAMKQEVAALATKLGLSPTLPKDEEELAQDHQKAMTDLNSKPVGREWDEAYLEHEVKMHKAVIDEVEEAVDKERRAEMKALLQKALTGLKGHLSAAEALEKKFGV